MEEQLRQVNIKIESLDVVSAFEAWGEKVSEKI